MSLPAFRGFKFNLSDESSDVMRDVTRVRVSPWSSSSKIEMSSSMDWRREFPHTCRSSTSYFFLTRDICAEILLRYFCFSLAERFLSFLSLFYHSLIFESLCRKYLSSSVILRPRFFPCKDNFSEDLLLSSSLSYSWFESVLLMLTLDCFTAVFRGNLCIFSICNSVVGKGLKDFD